MPPTNALLGHGSKFEVSTDGGTVWTELDEVFNITPPSDTVDFVEATHMRSPDATKEFILALRDPGEAGMEMNFIPGSASDLKLIAIRTARVAISARVTFPNGVVWTFTGLLTSYAPTIPNEDKMSAAISFKVSSSTVVSNEAAPTNTLIPAISGIAQVGQVLTAQNGIWTGAPVFTYQWQLDGGDIALANGATYTPVGGDLAGVITVDVTGTNTAGSATASSGGTADVIAA